MLAAIERDIPIPVERLWAILGDFGNMSWAPGIERTEVIGNGPGMIRRIHMPDMAPIDEVLEAIDPAALRFSYTIPSGMPLPVKNYRAEVQLTRLDDSHTRIRWACECEPDGIREADVEAVMTGAYTQMIGWLVKALS